MSVETQKLVWKNSRGDKTSVDKILIDEIIAAMRSGMADVDTSYSATSLHAQAGTAVAEAIAGMKASDEYDPKSSAPQSGKAVAQAISGMKASDTYDPASSAPQSGKAVAQAISKQGIPPLKPTTVVGNWDAVGGGYSTYSSSGDLSIESIYQTFSGSEYSRWAWKHILPSDNVWWNKGDIGSSWTITQPSSGSCYSRTLISAGLMGNIMGEIATKATPFLQLGAFNTALRPSMGITGIARKYSNNSFYSVLYSPPSNYTSDSSEAWKSTYYPGATYSVTSLGSYGTANKYGIAALSAEDAYNALVTAGALIDYCKVNGGSSVTVEQIYNAQSPNAQSGIAVAGALRTLSIPVVSDSYAATSSNAMSGKAVAAALKTVTITVDQTYIATSSNAASGKAVAAAIATIKVPKVTDTYSATSSNAMSGKAVASALSTISVPKITVDTTYNASSTNAISGKGVAAAISATYNASSALAMSGKAVASAISGFVKCSQANTIMIYPNPSSAPAVSSRAANTIYMLGEEQS